MDKAVRRGDLQQVCDLIRKGADVNEPLPFTAGGEGTVLQLAIERGFKDIALALLEAGADVHAKDRDGWTALRSACFMELEEVVQALINKGSEVNKQDKFCETPLMAQRQVNEISMCLLRAGASCEGLRQRRVDELFDHACRKGDVFVVHTLLHTGCRVSHLSREEQEGLLHHACHEGDVFVVHALFQDGCRVSILSREEQEGLLHHACREGDVFVVHALFKEGCRVSILSREEQEGLLHHACRKSNMLLVEALLGIGCNINCVDSDGLTPLMVAAKEDNEEVVKKLILAGANLGMRIASGNTALHCAAAHNNILCGILLVEGGASVRTKNNFSQTPLHLASAEFKKAIKETLSFATRKALCIIGNAESGKSTLIAALQAESNSFVGKIINRFRKVDDPRQRTAGIYTVPHHSQRYGQVLFFDFAGQDDYHGPHQMFLDSLLSKPGVSMTLLLVVKMTEEEEAILHQLHRWLLPVALKATTASPPHVIIIGSFLDKVKSKKEATAKLARCIKATRSDLKELDFIGSSFLNCHQPQSVGIDRICAFLQEIPIPEFGATQTHYSLAWVLSQIRSSITAQAVQLKEFSKWVEDNKYNLPQKMPSPEEVCQDLSATGHALYLPNRECPPTSWLLLDLPSILHDVYGTLFSQYSKIVNKFGLLQCHHLTELFPHLDLEMVQQLLISLEFCLPVDPSLLKLELSKLTQSEEISGWLFFPALISAKCPQSTLKACHQQSVRYLCWQLRTSKKHSISAGLLQTILLRLAAHFVVKQHNEEGVWQHCCSIWWNGIEWRSSKGIDVTVHIIHNRVIQVMSASEISADMSCQYLTEVISDILSTVQRLSPKLAAKAYIVHPPRTVTSPEDVIAPLPKELFPVEEIRSSYIDGFCLSRNDSNSDHYERVAIIDLFGGCIPSLNNIGRINWTCAQPQSSVQPSHPDVLSQAVYKVPATPSQPQSSAEQYESDMHRGAASGSPKSSSGQVLHISSPSPTGPSKPQSPTRPNKPQSPTRHSESQSPTRPNESQSPTRPNESQSPTRPNESHSPTRPNEFQLPTRPNESQLPTRRNESQSPTRPNESQSPTRPNESQSPTRPNESQSPTRPNESQSPTRPNESQSPTRPNESQSPTRPNESQSPTRPNESQSPTRPNESQSPTRPNESQSPTRPNESQSPTRPNESQSPTRPNESQSPTRPNESQSPIEPNQPVLHSEGGVLLDFTLFPSGAQALLDISSTPDMRDMDVLFVTEVAANWQRVALRLGVEIAVSSAILRNNPYDCEGACRDMLDRWLRGEHNTGVEKRTWSTLLTSLGRAGFVELERRLRREHFHKALHISSPSPTGPSKPQLPTRPNESQSPTRPNQPVLHSEGGVPIDFTLCPSGAQALLDVSSTPDMRDMDELVVTEVAANWQKVALRLGVEIAVTRAILRNNPNDCEGACRDMLDRWLRGEHNTGVEKRTWSTLLTALGRAGFVELERRLRKEHFHKVIST